MSQFIFTPGPWQYLAPVGSNDFRVDAWDRNHTGRLIRVAYVPNKIYTHEHGWPEHVERHANARLICAAPDMAEALAKIAHICNPTNDAILSVIHDLAQGAINKVTGA